MDALAFLAAGVSHDLANPLGAIRAFASFLASDDRLPDDLREDARLLRGEADRAQRITRTLLELTRARPPAVAPVDLGELLGTVLDLEDHVLAGITVERELPADLPLVETDPSRLRHLLLVLTVEAIRRLAHGERRRLRLHAAVGDAATVELSITFAADRAAVMRRLSLVPPVTALDGAAVVAATLGASVRTEDLPDGGRFVLAVPVPALAGDAEERTAAATADTARPTRTTAADAGQPAADRPTVLICDDEDAVRHLLVRLLERGGFRTLEAANGNDALALLDAAPVDVVVTDQRMAEMTGIELFEQATASRPELRSRFVVMSGDPGAEELVRFAEGTGVTILGKPFETGTIAATIRELADT